MRDMEDRQTETGADSLSAAYEQRTKELYDARGALAEAVSSLTSELSHCCEERRQVPAEVIALLGQAPDATTYQFVFKAVPVADELLKLQRQIRQLALENSDYGRRRDAATPNARSSTTSLEPCARSTAQRCARSAASEMKSAGCAFGSTESSRARPPWPTTRFADSPA